jgi:hypothetical protein
VAGVAALVIANGIAGPDAVRNALESSAEDKGPAGRDDQYGAGIVDAAGALGTVSTNTPPVAADDSATTTEDVAVVVAVLANDTDADGDPLTVTALAQPAHGAATLNADQSVTYTPAADFAGTDSFTYRAHDGTTAGNAATVTVEVAAVNDPPTANDDAATTAENTALTLNVLANDSDPDGDALSVASITQPTYGSAVLNADQTVTYTPNPSFVGDDAFTYTVTDTSGATDTATVTVTVQAAVENAHLAIAMSKATRGRSKWQPVADVLVSADDALGAPLAGATVNAHWSGAVTANVAGTTGPDGTVQFAAEWIRGDGTATFTVQSVIMDGTELPLTGDTSASISHATGQ